MATEKKYKVIGRCNQVTVFDLECWSRADVTSFLNLYAAEKQAKYATGDYDKTNVTLITYVNGKATTVDCYSI